MAYESYAEFLDALEKAGELIRVSEPIATELEITELADREMKKPGGGKALLFDVKGMTDAVKRCDVIMHHEAAISIMESGVQVSF